MITFLLFLFSAESFVGHFEYFLLIVLVLAILALIVLWLDFVVRKEGKQDFDTLTYLDDNLLLAADYSSLNNTITTEDLNYAIDSELRDRPDND